LTRGHQKLTAFLIGFPLFIASVAFSVIAAEEGDQVLHLFWPLALLFLNLWLWGVFAPMKED
jgi:hypothetical protein